MGIYDRDYMKPDAKAPLTITREIRKPKRTGPNLSLWSRLRFTLWLLLHPGKR